MKTRNLGEAISAYLDLIEGGENKLKAIKIINEIIQNQGDLKP